MSRSSRQIRKRVAIAHVCMGRGGSEARALWGVQALKDDYDVTLVTAGRVRANDIDDLNRFYGTSLVPGDFRILEAPVLPGMRSNLSAAALRGSLFQRYCRRIASRFDVLVSVYNLCDFGRPAIQFIADFCWDEELRQRYDPMPEEGQRLIHREGLLRRAYLAFARSLKRPSGRDLFAGDDLIVMNSKWTARMMQERYAVADAPIIYPPVVADFPEVAWDKKEVGFVCIGRIAHEKRVETMIEILRRVRERGHDVHLHVIGPIDDSPYGQMIRRLCAENARWVIVEGQKTGEEKVLLLTSHRFGIHARECEAFGISVAEMVKAGCIPFVPDRGGPPEIVGEPGLCYTNVDDGVTKIDALLRDELRQRQLAAALAERSRQFSAVRFMREFREVVDTFQAANR
jgi:glycosyltransferase involved in cell wall biosynthesis